MIVKLPFITKLFTIVGIFLFQTFAFSQKTIINFTSATDSISLCNNAKIAYTNAGDFSEKNISRLAFRVYHTDSIKRYPIPDTLQYAVLKFSVFNNQNENAKIYLTSTEDIASMQVLQLQGSEYKLVGKSGYASMLTNASIKNNDHQIALNPEKKSVTQYILCLKKYKYVLSFPRIELHSEAKYLTETAKQRTQSFSLYFLFTNFIAGFQFALLLFGIFKIYLFGFKKIYIFFSLQCLLFILFYSNEIHVLVFETKYLPAVTNKMVYEALGDLFIIVFNFLIINFFDLDRKSFLYRFLVWINLFWIVLFFVEAIPFINNPYVIKLFRFILNTAAIVDFITLLLIFCYAFYNRDGYRKYLFIGILIMLISSFEIAFPRFLNLIHLNPNWIKISDSSYLLLQICDNLNFCFFFIAFILKEKEASLEKISLELEHSRTLEELKNVKKLVEKENIILKDKTKVNLEQLAFIKANDHYLSIHTIEKKKHFVRGKLSEIMEELPSNFVKCHRSYIVNKNHIRKIQSKFIILKDNSEIPISRGFKI